MQYVRQFKNMDLDSFRMAGIDLIEGRHFPCFTLDITVAQCFHIKNSTKEK